MRLSWKIETELWMVRTAYRFNRRFACAIPVKGSLALGALIIAVGFFAGVPIHRASEVFAASGAIVAVLGVLVTLRPFLREEGGYLSFIKRMQTPFKEHEKVEQGEILLDADAINAAGPALIIVGTLVNGFSGFR